MTSRGNSTYKVKSYAMLYRSPASVSRLFYSFFTFAIYILLLKILTFKMKNNFLKCQFRMIGCNRSNTGIVRLICRDVKTQPFKHYLKDGADLIRIIELFQTSIALQNVGLLQFRQMHLSKHSLSMRSVRISALSYRGALVL